MQLEYQYRNLKPNASRNRFKHDRVTAADFYGNGYRIPNSTLLEAKYCSPKFITQENNWTRDRVTADFTDGGGYRIPNSMLSKSDYCNTHENQWGRSRVTGYYVNGGGDHIPGQRLSGYYRANRIYGGKGRFESSNTSMTHHRLVLVKGKGFYFNKDADKVDEQKLLNRKRKYSGPISTSNVLRSHADEVRALDDGQARKKKRLKWGQGLVKREKHGQVIKAKEMDESMLSTSPISFDCSMQYTDDDPSGQAAHIDNDTNYLKEPSFSEAANIVKDTNYHKEPSLCQVANIDNDSNYHQEASKPCQQNCSDEHPNKLDRLPSISMLTSLLNNLLEPENSCTGDTTFNNVQLFKYHIIKDLENTEYEIELLENELKSYIITVVSEPTLSVCSSSEHELKTIHANIDIPQNVTSNNIETFSENEDSTNTIMDLGSDGKVEDNFIDLFKASYGDALSPAPQIVDIWGSDMILACRKNDNVVKHVLALYKQQIKFKEQVLALRYRVLHHTWKVDLNLLSVKKQRPKSKEGTKLCIQTSQSRLQEQPLSTGPHLTLPAGNSGLIPTTKIIDFPSNLLSNSHIEPYRESLKMPAQIFDEREKRHSRFINNNNLIKDPLAHEKERSLLNPWTREEIGVFMQKFAELGKDFASISSSFSHKTIKDCIEFYYKNHKSKKFRDSIKLITDTNTVTSPITTLVLHPIKRDYLSTTESSEDKNICPDAEFGELESVYWTDGEKFAFLKALVMYGKDFAKISNFIGTKSQNQCKIFFSKARTCLNLDQIHSYKVHANESINVMNQNESKMEETISNSQLRPCTMNEREEKSIDVKLCYGFWDGTHTKVGFPLLQKSDIAFAGKSLLSRNDIDV